MNRITEQQARKMMKSTMEVIIAICLCLLAGISAQSRFPPTIAACANPLTVDGTVFSCSRLTPCPVRCYTCARTGYQRYGVCCPRGTRECAGGGGGGTGSRRCQGTCLGFANEQCRPGWDCERIPRSSLGRCCTGGPGGGRCPDRSSPNGRCSRGLGQPRCGFGFECIRGWCCRHPRPGGDRCPGGAAPRGRCSRRLGRARCGPGFDCIRGLCCRHSRPGVCPPASRRPCLTAPWDECSSDQHCSSPQKCCQDVCGQTCQMPQFRVG